MSPELGSMGLRSEQQKAALEHQLQVAWDMVIELRGCLVDKMQQENPEARSYQTFKIL